MFFEFIRDDKFGPIRPDPGFAREIGHSHLGHSFVVLQMGVLITSVGEFDGKTHGMVGLAPGVVMRCGNRGDGKVESRCSEIDLNEFYSSRILLFAIRNLTQIGEID
jgi:hypothetical protein